MIKKLIIKLRYKLNDLYERDDFVIHQIKKIKPGLLILDAGAGSQRYKSYCSHLKYFSQDFGKYKNDLVKTLDKTDVGGRIGYKYGPIDYLGNIWDIKEKDKKFDVILCTEVFEHIPYPNETIAEFSRLLKINGTLILTLPGNCLRHMDPYYFYAGFSDRWIEYFLENNSFKVTRIHQAGDYYSWISTELYRTLKLSNYFVRLLLLPAMLFFISKKSSKESLSMLSKGYFVTAKRIK